MTAQRLDALGRWWRIAGHDVDLSTEVEFEYPPNVRVALLLTRDAVTDEEHDLAAVLTWVVEEHPGWGGGCDTCGTSCPCPTQQQIGDYGLEWASAAAIRRYASLNARVADLEGRLRERSA